MTSGPATPLMLDLAASHMRDRHRDARQRADRVAARKGRARVLSTFRTR